MHHVLATLNCAVWSSWVWAPLPTRSGAQHCTVVATHLLTTTLFGAGVFLEKLTVPLDSFDPIWNCAQQNEVLGFSFSEESPSPVFSFFVFHRGREVAFSVHNPNLNFANVRRCWFDLYVQNPPKCTVEKRGVQMTRGPPELLRGRSKLSFMLLLSFC